MRFLEMLLCILILGGCAAKEDIKTEQALTPLQQKEAFLTAFMDNMTLEEKIGQLLMCDFRTDENGLPITEINSDIKNAIKNYNLGGIILFAENIDEEAQTKKLTSDLQNASEIPLFIGVDEEGGIVSRLSKSGKLDIVKIPPAAEIGKTGDTNIAYKAGNTIGNELKNLGINVNFAPVADIFTNPENTVIGKRAFGTTAKEVAPMVVAFVEGLEETGVSGAVKHFPGHGDTNADTHNGEVFAVADRQRLETVEFVPFKSAIDAGVDMVMVAHIKTPNATSDNLEASVSSEMISGILRQYLGFNGVVITDALNMKAIVDAYGSGEAAVMAILAGADIALMPSDYKQAYDALLNAVNSGSITHEQIDSSVKRILVLKYDKGFFEVK